MNKERRYAKLMQLIKKWADEDNKPPWEAYTSHHTHWHKYEECQPVEDSRVILFWRERVTHQILMSIVHEHNIPKVDGTNFYWSYIPDENATH